MQLDFVVQTSVALAGAAKQDAAVVMLYMPHKELQLEIAELFVGRQVTGAVGMDHLAERLKLRLSIGDVPLAEIFGPGVEGLPAVGGRQFADAQIAKAVRIGERFEAQIALAEAMAQLGYRRDVQIVNDFVIGPDAQARPVHQNAETVPL